MTKTIANAIKQVNGEGVRKAIVNHRMQVPDLHTQYIEYEEKKRLAGVLEGILNGTKYGKLVPRLVDMIMETDQPRVLYLNSLKFFGKKSGTEVYRRIKDCVAGVRRVGELEVW